MKKSKLAIMSAALLLAIASGCNLENPSTSSEQQSSTSTSSVDTKQEALNGAAEFLYQANKDVVVNTANYKLPAKQFYDGVSYDVTWTVTVKSGPAANVSLATTAENNYYAVTVVYDPFSSNEEVAYTLTATVKDEEGRTASASFERKIPVFSYTSHADYLKAEAKDLVNVEGYVTAKTPRQSDGYVKMVFVETAKGEGFYLYGLSKVSEDDYKIGTLKGLIKFFHTPENKENDNELSKLIRNFL